MQGQSRRKFLHSLGSVMGTAAAWPAISTAARLHEQDREIFQPNVVLIMTDDQGYGDLGAHGNDLIDTPNLDRFAAESAELRNFYVMPCCSPTRACLMTGRYNYRTGVVDTYHGRSMLYPDEVTMAEVFRSAGYRTGIFGKWHLGDNYPLRPMDQGFDEVLVHKGSGIGFVADPKGNKYFDPVLQVNGEPQRFQGYCTDIFTNGAIRFVQQNQHRSFFLYLAPNAPHEPLQIGDEYVAPYLAKGLFASVARFYGMVTNIDDNVGRLLREIDDLGLRERTVVVFLSDNGPWWKLPGSMPRYNAGLRGKKTEVYEGGVRVPCYIRWPGALQEGIRVERIAGGIDLLPTLLDLAGIPPLLTDLDGISLKPLLEDPSVDWQPRTLFAQWHRGDVPELYRNCMARSDRYKMVDGWKLFDLENDPGESVDIGTSHPEILADLRAQYEAWFADVSSTRGFDPPRIHLGTAIENPTTLTPLDWRGPETRWKWERLKSGGWYWDGRGYWEVHIAQSGLYQVTIEFPTLTSPARAYLDIDGMSDVQEVNAWDSGATFRALELPAGDARLDVWLAVEDKLAGVSYVYVERWDDQSIGVDRKHQIATTWGQVRRSALYPNYPNPFNPETWIPYELAEEASVGFRIFDASGRVVRTLELGSQPAGVYRTRGRAAHWDGRDESGQPVASGLYFCQILAGDFSAVRRLVVAE